MATRIMVKDNASIHIEGDFELFDFHGNKFDVNGRTLIKLCRCGASKDKPFCDGAHRAANFQSEVKATTLPPLTPKT